LIGQDPPRIHRTPTDVLYKPNTTVKKFYSGLMGDYILVFKYDSNSYMIPQTYPEGVRHYEARVGIFKRYKQTIHYDLVYTFWCTYTKGLCYEDDISDLVYESYKLRWDRWKKPHRITIKTLLKTIMEKEKAELEDTNKNSDTTVYLFYY
jgi:hypothetical protein